LHEAHTSFIAACFIISHCCNIFCANLTGTKAIPGRHVFHQNIPYANDTLQKHLLDIYLPPDAKKSLPLIVWIHGGAWMLNDKYADMGYMKNTVKSFIDSGYAVASINYRYSTDSVFSCADKRL
jgi:acetyl esterase/lipase